MEVKNIILKGFLIFGILGFIVFILLVIAGFIMSLFGIGCRCYEIFAWSLVGVGILTAIIFWFGCCCKNKENDECKGIKGHKDVLKENQ